MLNRNRVVPIYIAINAACLVLTIIEIILLAKHLLRPLTFILMNGVKTTIWTGLFIWHIVDLVTPGMIHYSANSISLISTALLLYVRPLSYSSSLNRSPFSQ